MEKSTTTWKVTPKGIITPAIHTVLIILAIWFKPAANLHLAVTVLCFGLYIYFANLWVDSNATNKDGQMIGYIVFAFLLNTIITFCMGWWVRGIMWSFISAIYIGFHTEKKEENKNKKEETS